jgi:hypothetical protein
MGVEIHAGVTFEALADPPPTDPALPKEDRKSRSLFLFYHIPTKPIHPALLKEDGKGIIS